MATSKNILIILLILVLGFFVLSNSTYIKDTGVAISRIDTLIKDTTIYKYKKGKDIPFVVLDTFFLVDSFKIHDTEYIVKDWKEIKIYSDTLHIDTAQYVFVADTISQNRILGRAYGGHFVQKTITITNTIKSNSKNEFYIGFIGDYNRLDQRLGAGIGVIYKKQKESYSLNYTTNHISVGLYKKLF